MISAYFSCSNQQFTLQERLITLLQSLREEKYQSHKVKIEIMLFAFTDIAIFKEIVLTASAGHVESIKILADYSNISDRDHRLIRKLIDLNHPKITIRFKSDFPYVWDDCEEDFIWDYKAGKGFLHHKSMMVLVNNEPALLHVGSYNWTKNSNLSYENSMIIECSQKTKPLLNCFHAEFTVLWTTMGLSLSLEELLDHQSKMRKIWKQDHEIPATFYLNFDMDSLEKKESEDVLEDNLVAFNAVYPLTDEVMAGFSPQVRNRMFPSLSSQGEVRYKPLTCTNLSIDFLNRSNSGSTVKMAMFAFSSRVAEFNAILQAARRGVHFKIVLDQALSDKTYARLKDLSENEMLPIELKMSNRMMHQKYLVNEIDCLLLTGTANFTTDSKYRHAEHRFLFAGDSKLIRQFVENFDIIWKRLKK